MGTHTRTAVVALLLCGLGFFGGAAGSAWRTRVRRADPWRKMHVDHEGVAGTTTRTRVVFDNPSLPLQAVEVVRSPDGAPVVGRVVLRDGAELTARYEGEVRPTSVEAADRSRAHIVYEGKKAHIDYFDPSGRGAGSRVVTVPVELRSVLRIAAADRSLLDTVAGALVGEAWAQPPPPSEEQVTVQRHLEVGLDLRLAGTGEPGTVQLEASCPPLAASRSPPRPRCPAAAP
jgi:hypothetical protein